MLPTRRERTLTETIIAGVLAVTLAGTLLVVGVLARDFVLTPATSAPSPSGSASASPSLIAFDSSNLPTQQPWPPEVIQMAVAMATYYAPTPTPTPWPTHPPTTPDLTIFCGQGSRVGEICEWPPDPLPTATPHPTCVTPAPGNECRWLGTP